MNRLLPSLTVVLVLAFLPFFAAGAALARTGDNSGQRAAIAALLSRAYPDFAFTLEEKDGCWYLNPAGGPAGRIVFDDRVERAGEELQNNPSVLDMFSQAYRFGASGRYPDQDSDPGRARNTELLKALYGRDRRAVESALVRVDFLGRKVLFNSRHGAAAALERVGRKLLERLESHPREAVWLFPVIDPYAWRKISGAPRLSAHSFGIAIDLNPQKATYWRYRPSAELLERTRREYPQAIVDIFEGEGFVWGGKWSHFDFMHFEYRPEIALFARTAEP